MIARRPAAAGAVAIDLRHAMAIKFKRKFVREPSRAGIAAGGVAGPPGELHRAIKRLAVLPQHARQLQQRSVTGRVVADADIPTVVMAVHQDERVLVLGAWNGSDRDLLLEPADLHFGLDGHLAALFGERHQLLTVGVVDGDDGDFWRARQVGQIGRAPDGGAGTPMDVDARRAGLPKPDITTILPPTFSFTSSSEAMEPPNSVAMSRL